MRTLKLYRIVSCRGYEWRQIHDIIDEEEFLLLWEVNKSKNLDFPVHNHPRFDLASKDDCECKAEFTARKQHVHALRT